MKTVILKFKKERGNARETIKKQIIINGARNIHLL